MKKQIDGISISLKRDTAWIGFDKKGYAQFVSCNLNAFLDWGEGAAHTMQDLFVNHPEAQGKLSAALEGVCEDMLMKTKDKIIYLMIRDEYPLEENAEIFVLLSDISKDAEVRKKLSKELESAKAINENNDRFSYIISHDLTEPVRTVGNFTQLLEMELAGKLNGETQAYMDYIKENVTTLQNLISDLLSYNRASRAKLITKELLVEDLVHLQEYKLKELLAEKGAKISLVNTDAKILGDAKWLGQVFFHLVRNAIMYNDSPQPEVIINVEHKNDHCCITFTDNGVGIPEESKDTVFLLLGRVGRRPDANGTGVGLAVVKTIIDMHNGDISFTPKEGGGTIFCIKLPLHY